MNEDQAAWYLAAMIDGEGTVSHSGHTRHVLIANTDDDIIEATEQALRTLGIVYVKYLRPRKMEHHLPIYNLVIRHRDAMERLYDTVPIQSIKKQRLRIVLESYQPRRPETEVLQEMYDRGMSPGAIGRALGFNQSSVRDRLVKAGVSLRTMSESAQLRHQREGRRHG